MSINLEALLSAIDKEKAEKIISELLSNEPKSNKDLNKILGEIKKNPEVLEKLKKLF